MHGDNTLSHMFHDINIHYICSTFQELSVSSYPGLISGGLGNGFVKPIFPTSQYVSSTPLP